MFTTSASASGAAGPPRATALVSSCALFVACGIAGWGCTAENPKDSSQSVSQLSVVAYDFQPSSRSPSQLTPEQINAFAVSGLRVGETVSSVSTRTAPGIGHTVVLVVATTADDSRAYVVDEDGVVLPTQEFWARESEAHYRRFGRMSAELFAVQAAMEPSSFIEVSIMVRATTPEPERPYDGTELAVPIAELAAWSRQHADAQVARVTLAKARVRTLLDEHGGEVISNPRGLPWIRTKLPVALLRSQALHSSDVVRIDEVSTEIPQLLGYAGRAAMGASAGAGGLYGGDICGGPCDGGGIQAGLWEASPHETEFNASGIAKNNARFYAGSIIQGYLTCPKTCSSEDQCEDIDLGGGAKMARRCRAATPTGEQICVQDHLTWVAASVGMYGNYNYPAESNSPNGDGIENAPPSTTFASTGAWDANLRIGNDFDLGGLEGLDFLVTTGCPNATDPSCQPKPCQQPNAPPALYVNRSQSTHIAGQLALNWAARAYGTFVTQAAGNGADSCNRRTRRTVPPPQPVRYSTMDSASARLITARTMRPRPSFVRSIPAMSTELMDWSAHTCSLPVIIPGRPAGSICRGSTCRPDRA